MTDQPRMTVTSILEEFQAKGETRGQVKMLLRLLERRFDELPDWAAAKVSGGSADDLQAWAIQILTADTLADVFR